MKRLAVIVSRGEFNSLVQVATLLLAAAGSGVAVRVFFRDEAIYKITVTGAKEMNFSETYQAHEALIRDRLTVRGSPTCPTCCARLRSWATRASTHAHRPWRFPASSPINSCLRSTAFAASPPSFSRTSPPRTAC